MRIGLINPNKKIKEPAVHLGLGYIAAYAREEHSDISFLLLDTRLASNKEQKIFFETEYDYIFDSSC